MKTRASRSFGAQLKGFREAAGFTQEELATIAGLSVHGVSALERGERRRPHVDTVRALCAALDLTGETRDAFIGSARATVSSAPASALRDVSLPQPLTLFLGRDADVKTLRVWLTDPTARLITLTGPGGAGKTRLALELARTNPARAFRVMFVELGAVAAPRSLRPRLTKRWEWRTLPPSTCRGARGSRVTISSHCSYSTISNSCWTRRRWSWISWNRSPRSEFWSPAVPRSVCEESASTPWDHWRWIWTSTPRRPPISRAFPRSGYSSSGF